MSGSLLQIVSTDLKDAYLTIDPQITFFKIVYLRHTPFAIDLIEETFNTTPNFGEEGFCQLRKIGDMISSIFLKIEIPSVQISNQPDAGLRNLYTDTAINYYNGEFTAEFHINYFNNLITYFKEFSSSAMVYWREIDSVILNMTSNYNTVSTLLNKLITGQNNTNKNYMLHNNRFSNVSIYFDTLELKFNFDILTYIQTSFISYKDSIYNTNLNIEYKAEVKKYLNDYLEKQKYYLKYLITSRDLFVRLLKINTSPYYCFSWVQKLAFALIDNLSIEINGQEIDRVNSDVLSIWYELSTPLEKLEILDKMIGNINILTNYDSSVKPSYTLLIPIPFWFCKYKSQALPCVGLKYSDIIIRVKFNELTNCCYFEPYEQKTYSSNVNINDLVKISNVSLLVEYIHLGETERVKFGTFTIESLIEQHRLIKFSNITTQNLLLPLDFVNPVRELIWTIQKKSHYQDLKLHFNYSNDDFYRGSIIMVKQSMPNMGYLFVTFDSSLYISNVSEYLNGTLEIFNSKYYNGTYTILEIGYNFLLINSNKLYYPDNFIVRIKKQTSDEKFIKLQTIQIYGSDLISKREPEYFSLVNNTLHTYISQFIYSYSFCRNPEIFQPTGTLNFTVIDSKNLYLELDEKSFTKLIKNNDSYIIKIISRSHNLFKIENGQGSTLFGL